MIYGIGTDIIEIARMAGLFERHGERALEKILSPTEIALCRQKADPGRYMAKRFAAKEALAKALGTGIRPPVLLTAITVLNDEHGKPVFDFAPELAAFLQQKKLLAHLSISDERDTAVAFVIVEQS